MSTIFNVRNFKLPNVSRTALIIGAIVVVLALIGGVVAWQLYKKLTYNTVVAYFPQTLALYAGDKVEIMGVKALMLVLQDGYFLLRRGIADLDLEQKTIKLRFRKRIGAFKFDGILRGKNGKKL